MKCLLLRPENPPSFRDDRSMRGLASGCETHRRGKFQIGINEKKKKEKWKNFSISLPTLIVVHSPPQGYREGNAHIFISRSLFLFEFRQIITILTIYIYIYDNKFYRSFPEPERNCKLTVCTLTLRVIARTRLILPAGTFAFKITRVFNERSCTISNGKIM